jgi:hypothetical protein
MKTTIGCLKYIVVVICVLLLDNCFYPMPGNGSSAISEGDPRWGAMKPGGKLICTRRQFFYESKQKIILDPYCVSPSSHNGPKIIGSLNPGTSLTVWNLRATSSVTTTWIDVYTTDEESRKIIIGISGSEFLKDQEWENLGFRVSK